MNWKSYRVEERDLQELINYGKKIEVEGERPIANSGVVLITDNGKQYNAIYDAELDAFRKINTANPQFRDMANRDLALYNDHLLNESVNTIIVDGLFGTGKTSIVCSHLVEGLKNELEHQTKGIRKAYISKPHVGLGESYGYLPGDLMAKMEDEFRSYTQYFDRFGNPGFADFLLMRDIEESKRIDKEKVSKMEEAMLEMLPFEYIRGRDIDNGWVILDEAQNTNVKEAGTFVARNGDAAKLIIIGDTSSIQIDRKGNTPEHNGLQFVKKTYSDKKYAAYVSLNTVQHILRGQRAKDMYLSLKATEKDK